MAKRKSAIQRLAEAVAELGIEESGKHFEFLKAMSQPEPKTRKQKPVAVEAKAS